MRRLKLSFVLIYEEFHWHLTMSFCLNSWFFFTLPKVFRRSSSVCHHHSCNFPNLNFWWLRFLRCSHPLRMRIYTWLLCPTLRECVCTFNIVHYTILGGGGYNPPNKGGWNPLLPSALHFTPPPVFSSNTTSQKGLKYPPVVCHWAWGLLLLHSLNYVFLYWKIIFTAEQLDIPWGPVFSPFPPLYLSIFEGTLTYTHTLRE